MNENKLRVGFHCTVVRPPLGMRIPGTYTPRYAEGFLTDLHLRAAAFVCEEQKAIIFSVEAIGVNASAFDEIKKKVAQRCNMDENAVFINCSHVHTAYRITRYGTEDIDETDIFLMRLYQQFSDCAQFAFEDLRPCTVKVATGEVPGVGFMRRYRMKDGTCRSIPPVGSPDIVSFVGRQDDSIQLVRFIREGGKEIVMAAFGTHADVVTGPKYCADWPGYLVEFLNGAFQGDIEAMTLLKCEGDSNHKNAFWPKGTVTRGPDFAKRMARILAGEVLKIYDSAVEVPADHIGVFTKDLKIGQNACDPADIPIAKEVQRIFAEKGEYAPELKNFKMDKSEALRIIANLSRPEFFEIRLHALQIGNVAFVGIPGEPFASIGIDITKESDMDMTVVTACTNGCEGYYPDQAAFDELGYESKVSPFASNCGRLLIDGSLEMIHKMKRI